jgi:hypothetical protein
MSRSKTASRDKNAPNLPDEKYSFSVRNGFFVVLAQLNGFSK